MSIDSLELTVVDDRPDHGHRIRRLKWLEDGYLRCHLFDERVVELSRDDYLVRRHAYLALMKECGEERRVHRVVDIRILQNDYRIFAASPMRYRKGYCRKPNRDEGVLCRPATGRLGSRSCWPNSNWPRADPHRAAGGVGAFGTRASLRGFCHRTPAG